MSELFAELRPLLFSIAYRMLGGATEAEDIVQEAYLRFHRETVDGRTTVESPKAYLSAITTRLSIDHLRSARVRRESYIGTWLPEPLLTETEPDAAQHAETADSLSLGFLVLLESLTPVERAVFLLREVFDFGYEEIAGVVGKSEDNCRQIAVRARRQVHAGSLDSRHPRRGNRSSLGSSSRPRARETCRGSSACWPPTSSPTRTGAARRWPSPGPSTDVTGSPASCWGAPPGANVRASVGCGWPRSTASPARCSSPDRVPVVAVSLDIADDLVQTLHAVSNPEKLEHLRKESASLGRRGDGPPRGRTSVSEIRRERPPTRRR